MGPSSKQPGVDGSAHLHSILHLRDATQAQRSSPDSIASAKMREAQSVSFWFVNLFYSHKAEKIIHCYNQKQSNRGKCFSNDTNY